MSAYLAVPGALPFDVLLEPDEEATDDLKSVFSAYWDLASFGEPAGAKWARPTSWGNDAASAAGGGGVATALERARMNCRGPLTLTSRAAFAQAERGDPTRCRDCTAHFNDRVAKLTAPEAVKKRAARLTQKREAVLAAATQANLADARQAAVRARYGTPRGDSAPGALTAGITQLVLCLALLRHHTQAGIIGPLADHETLLAPDSSADLLVSTIGSFGLLAVHPSTASHAFVWQADDGITADQFDDRWYPHRLRLYRDTAEPPETATTGLASEVGDLLDLALMTSSDQEELILLARDTVAGEGARYLEYQLERYNLPPISSQNRQRLRAVMQRAADCFSLGSIYQQAWSAASSATNLYQSTRTTRDKASTYALNKFERRLAELIEKPDSALGPYRLIDQVPLSSLARTIFYDVFRRDIAVVSIPDLRSSLPTAIDEWRRARCLEAPPYIDADALSAILDQVQGLGLDGLRATLSTDDEECAPGCSHALANLSSGVVVAQLDALAVRLGSTAASVAVVAGLQWLDHRNDLAPAAVPGTVLLTRVQNALHLDGEDNA